MCCTAVIFSVHDFIFRMLPALLRAPLLVALLSMQRVRCACSRKRACDKTCKRMSALATWRLKVAGIRSLHAIPLRRHFRHRNRADDPWPAAAPSY